MMIKNHLPSLGRFCTLQIICRRVSKSYSFQWWKGKLFQSDICTAFYQFLEEDNATHPSKHICTLKSLQMCWCHYIYMSSPSHCLGLLATLVLCQLPAIRKIIIYHSCNRLQFVFASFQTDTAKNHCLLCPG